MPASATIGVSGMGHCAGATHLCIALANFLCSGFFADTAYLELGGRREISSIARKHSDDDRPFIHQRVVYYPNVTANRLAEVLAGRYRYFVLDFGGQALHMQQAFSECSIRLVIGNICPWKKSQFARSVQKSFYNKKTKEDVVYLGNYMECKSDQREVEKKCGINIIPVPYLPDPFRIASENFGFFEKIMEENELSHE